MFRDLRIRSPWILGFFLAAVAFGAKQKHSAKAPSPLPPPPFPASTFQRTGYNGGPSDALCCQSRPIGWTKEGLVAVLSSTFSPDEELFRYGIDLHDPAFMDPEEIFSETFFLADDSLPRGCEGESDPLRCVWKRHQKEIGDLLRMHGVSWSDIRMRPPPRVEIHTIGDPLPAVAGQQSIGLSLFENAGRVTLEMPDSSDAGLHLSPLGTIVRNRPTPIRYMVMRLYSREAPYAPPRELGARLLKMADP